MSSIVYQLELLNVYYSFAKINYECAVILLTLLINCFILCFDDIILILGPAEEFTLVRCKIGKQYLAQFKGVLLSAQILFKMTYYRN